MRWKVRTVAIVSVAMCVLLARRQAGAQRPVEDKRLAPVTLKDGQPVFHIPPQSRLARNEHPRCLLCEEDLQRVKARLNDPRIAREFEIIKARALEQNAWILEQALVYRLTGDHRYLEALRGSPQFSRPTWLFGWPAAIDLVWDDLSEQERSRLSDAVVQAVARDGYLYWRPTLQLVSVFYEGGRGHNDAVLLERMKQDFQRQLVRWTEKLNRWAAGRGGSDMGHGYNGEHAYWEPFIAAICWTNCTGEDYLSRAEFAKYQSAFYWYHFVPSSKGLCVEHIGVTRDCADLGAISPGHSGSVNLAWLTVSREQDGLGPVWLDRVRQQEPPWRKYRDALGRLIWWDPQLQPIDPATIPTTRLFPTSGHVVMRSDWSAEATFAVFRCGRFGEIDGLWGRNNADNLSFTIRKCGPLAIDSGPCHGENTRVLKFYQQGVAGAVYEYGRQTIAHNSITIGTKEFVHLDWRGQPTSDVVRRGGQSVRQAPEWWKEWGFAGPQEHFMEGRITAYCTHPLFDYALGDARWSYNPADVEQITRQFLYLKPDVFVIFDRIVVKHPEDRPCWLLHSLRSPEAFGGERALSPAEIGPQKLQLAADNLVDHPSPGGHFLMQGSGFWVQSGSPQKEGPGWLRVETLVPSAEQAERIKIGGRGHDFEVAGIQYGPTPEGYHLAEDAYAVRNTIGLDGWRVELRWKKPAPIVEFLHVLHAGKGSRAQASQPKLQSDNQWHIVTVDHAGKRFEVRLRRVGARGGAIHVVSLSDNSVLYDAPLPQTVEDHYHYYKDHPHYKLWMTDPRYRVLIYRGK